MLSSKLQELAEDGTWQVISAPQSILNFSQPLQVKSVCFHFLKVLIWALRLQLGKVPIKKKKKITISSEHTEHILYPLYQSS